MYYRFLDWWDERRAQRGDELKTETVFTIDAGLAFPNSKKITNIAEFCALADQAVADETFFDEPSRSDFYVERQDGWIRFPSSVRTHVESNNVVWARITEGRSSSQALVVFHHWNANSRYPQIANFFSRRGITVVEIAMPYHLERSRPASSHADYMLSPNLGRTIQSTRQAVLDGRKLIRVLKIEGYEKISVLGMSLGSWVAGLIAAHDPAVGKAALFLTAGSFADMVWTGRATRHIRASFEDEIELAELRRAWGPLNLENYADRLVRPDLDLQVVLAKRDTVVLPELSNQLTANLKKAGGELDILELNCGHYSLSLPPHALQASLAFSRFLTRNH